MTHEIQPIQTRDHRVRNAAGGASLILAGVLVGGALGSGAFNGKDASPSYTPNPTSIELATPSTSAAAGSASPEASASVAPSASAEAPQFVVVKDGSVGENTIIRLPENTVITGDPIFLGGQPGLGQQLEDYQKFQIDVTQEGTQSIAGGQTLIDSDPTTGAVFVTKVDTYIQSGLTWGFSYQTVQNSDQAEKLALGQKFVTEHLGCGGGCQHVDIIHFPGDPAQGTTGTDSTNPSQSPMPSESPIASIYPLASEMPGGNINPGSITKDEEIIFLQNLINSGKVDMNSDSGKILANLLLCLECSTTVCETPTATPTPKPSPEPTPTPAACIPTKKDTVMKAGSVIDTHGNNIIIEGAANIDGVDRFTPNNNSNLVKQVDELADGKNHHVVIKYPSDVQEFNNCANPQFIQNTYNHDLTSDSRALDSKSIKLTR